MANLTLAIEDDVLRRARIRALERGTSVNEVVREYLKTYVGDVSGDTIVAELHRIEARVHAGSGPGGRTWRREDLYDR